LLKGIWQNMCCMDCMVSRCESFFSWEGVLGAVVVVVVVIVAVILILAVEVEVEVDAQEETVIICQETDCLLAAWVDRLSAVYVSNCLKGCNTCQETNGFCGGTCLGYCSQMLAWTICVRAMPMIHWAHKSILDQFLCLGVEISFACS
jgi:hypothetical protein